MGRPVVLAVVVALAASASYARPAAAAGDCPEGGWFCEPAPAGPPEPPPELPPQGEPEPPPGAPEPNESVRIDVEHVRPAKRRRSFREWGLNLHAAFGILGGDALASPDAGMNGVGGALRFRPIPHLAFEGAVEAMWGVDYRGFERFESALLANALYFANPRSAVQLYLIAGAGMASAWVQGSYVAGTWRLSSEETNYLYFGGQLGLGVEGRVTRQFALGVDLLGFIRGRIDQNAGENPEYVDPDHHRSTNASGGGVVRAGFTYYF